MSYLALAAAVAVAGILVSWAAQAAPLSLVEQKLHYDGVVEYAPWDVVHPGGLSAVPSQQAGTEGEASDSDSEIWTCTSCRTEHGNGCPGFRKNVRESDPCACSNWSGAIVNDHGCTTHYP